MGYKNTMDQVSESQSGNGPIRNVIDG